MKRIIYKKEKSTFCTFLTVLSRTCPPLGCW